MAHWAKINENNIVENIIVTENNEDDGQEWVRENLDGVWLQTSYNTARGEHLLGGTPFRKNFAEVGGMYILEIDGFVPPKRDHEELFVLNEELGIWVPPLSPPEDADFIYEYGHPYSLEDLSPESNVYYWIVSCNQWGMFSNAKYPKPTAQHYWNPVEKEWQLPDSEKPGDNYYWDAIKKQWLEVPLPPTE